MSGSRFSLLLKRPLFGPVLAALVLLLTSIGLVVGTSPRTTHASGSFSPAPTRTHAQRTATCSEPTSGGSTTTWTARYESIPDKAGRVLRVTALAGDNPAGTDGAWTLWWAEKNNLVHHVSSSPADLARLQSPMPVAVLLPPTADCSIVLTSNVTPRSIAVIGDSIFSGINAGLESQRLAQTAFTSRLLVTAESGYGWGASTPTWPLTTIRGTWALGLLRGLIPYEPRCVVVELGANDALRATFADALRQPRRAADIRRAAADNLELVLSTAKDRGMPVVLVTASEFPVKAYGAGVTYSHEAALVNATIRSLAGSSHGRVVLADWAAQSARHHRPRPAGNDWFIDDELHPNSSGELALLDLVQQSSARAGCG